jgi:hypothetical protein
VNGFRSVWLSGLVGAIAGAVTALAAQFLGHRLAAKRELLRFQIQSFERFRREFTEDENLRAISIKKQPLTADEIDDYLGFFEEVGLYFHRGLVDVELVDEVLGDSIIDAWEDEYLRREIGSIRGAEDDPTYFRYFEQLAKHLIEMREKRIKGRR